MSTIISENHMNFKDCLFGQVRKLNAYPDSKCTDLPNDLAEVVTGQEIITWDNATGMNPLYGYLPEFTVDHMSYGEMLTKTFDMEYLNSLTDGKRLHSEKFEDLIREDYNNEFTRLCKLLGQWWHMHHFLKRPDLFLYDYIILRQIDTLFNPDVNAEMLVNEMEKRNQKFFSSRTVPAGVPVCYDFSFDMKQRHPSTTWIPSHGFILNPAAIHKLKDNFYQFAVAEIDHYWKMLGTNIFLPGDPGVIMPRICIKQNVEPISIRDPLLHPAVCRGGDKGGTVDFSNLDRTGV